MFADKKYSFDMKYLSKIIILSVVANQVLGQNASNCSDQRTEYNLFDVCRSLVGLSRGAFCPVVQPTCRQLPRNCQEVLDFGFKKSGIYEILPTGTTIPVMVLCEQELRGGGWTHIQKRYDGSEDFYREYRFYKFGFGNLKGEFWMGLENIYDLTGLENNELLVELTDFNGVLHYASYTSFVIGTEYQGYNLKTASGYSGDAGNSLANQLGQKFTTKDLDRDLWPVGNCADYGLGGWWYNNCYSSNLNGKYMDIPFIEAIKRKGLNWDLLPSPKGSFLAGSRMLIRPN